MRCNGRVSRRLSRRKSVANKFGCPARLRWRRRTRRWRRTCCGHRAAPHTFVLLSVPVATKQREDMYRNAGDGFRHTQSGPQSRQSGLFEVPPATLRV